MLSDLIESHSPVFFLSWFVLRFPVKMYAKKLGGTFCNLLLNDKQKKPFVFPNNETSEASCSRLFFAYVFTQKWSANQREKIQGCDFLLNLRPHAKLQLIWTKKRKTDQNSTKNGYAATSSIIIDNVLQFASATKKNRNNMESLTLQADGPLTGRDYIRGGL